MLDFYKTIAGRTFIESTMPKLFRSIERQAVAQERANELAELQMAQGMSDTRALEYFPNNELVKKMIEHRKEDRENQEDDDSRYINVY